MKRTDPRDQPIWLPARGTWQCRIPSPHAVGASRVEVLVPDRLGSAGKCRVLYALPVESSRTHRYGDAIKVLRELGAHNRCNLIIVVPSFPIDPWYGNHATNPGRRFEDYLVKTLVPWIERRFAVEDAAEGRFLLGFSKSGWGAFTLLLRHPKVFGYAASWDAPLMMSTKQFGIWRTGANFGTPATMARHLPSTLLRRKAPEFRDRPRLVLAGETNFGTSSDPRFPYDGPSHTEAFHALADALGVKHRYAPDLRARHSWNPKWVSPVLDLLMGLPPAGRLAARRRLAPSRRVHYSVG